MGDMDLENGPSGLDAWQHKVEQLKKQAGLI